MNKTNLSGIDLNLLVVLAALLEERNVTAAAHALGRSQSAVSHALRRLRMLLNDPLFIRSAEGMAPTPAALSFKEELNDVLTRVENLLTGNREFEAGRSKRCFTIGFTDYTSFVFLPNLVAALDRTAPGVELVIKNTSWTMGYEMLDKEEAEIIVGNFPAPPNSVTELELYRERFVCVMNPDHPAARGKLTRDSYQNSKHISVSLQGKMIGFLDRAIHKVGITRKSRAIIGHFTLAPYILLKTDSIATEPERIMLPMAKMLGLVAKKPPFEVEPMPIKMAWSRRYDGDEGHKWMRDLIRSLA